MAQQPEYMHPRQQPEFHQATTLDAATIRNAVIYDDPQAKRQIREYGRLRAKIFNELVHRVELSENA